MEDEEGYTALKLRPKMTVSDPPHQRGTQDHPPCPRWYWMALGIGWAGNIVLLGAVVAMSVWGNSKTTENNFANERTTYGANYSTELENVLLRFKKLLNDSSSSDSRGQRRDCPSVDLGLPTCPTYPDGWVRFQGKCYYFSADYRDWTSSQDSCSSYSASLAVIDTQEDKDFMARYKVRGQQWIGLQRDSGQSWKWVNGDKFNSRNWLQTGGGGDCAYLHSDGRVISTQCSYNTYWICTKPAVFTKRKETAVEGGS